MLISGGGHRPLLLLLGTDETAASFWRADTAGGPVLVRGTAWLCSPIRTTAPAPALIAVDPQPNFKKAVSPAASEGPFS